MCTAETLSYACPLWVKRVASTRSRCARHVRYASNSDQIDASQQTVALCQNRTNDRSKKTPLFNQFVGAQQERLRDRETQRLRHSDVHHQLELGWLLDRDIGGLSAAQNLVDEIGGASEQVGIIRSIGHQTVWLDVIPRIVQRRQLYRERKGVDAN